MSPVTTFLHDRPPMRGLMWLGLSETGRMLVRSEVSDDGGGTTETYTPGPDLACRIDAVGRQKEGEAADRVSDRTTHFVYFPVGIAVSLDDDFEIDGIGRFEITAIRRHTGEMATQIEVTDRTA